MVTVSMMAKHLGLKQGGAIIGKQMVTSIVLTLAIALLAGVLI